MKFHENPSNGSRVVPCWRSDRRTDRTKLIVFSEILRTRLTKGPIEEVIVYSRDEATAMANYNPYAAIRRFKTHIALPVTE
jgi:hypothetical protein